MMYLSADAYLCDGTYADSTSRCPSSLRYIDVGVIASIITTSLWIVQSHLQRKIAAKMN